jgi:acyl carrier protein
MTWFNFNFYSHQYALAGFIHSKYFAQRAPPPAARASAPPAQQYQKAAVAAAVNIVQGPTLEDVQRRVRSAAASVLSSDNTSTPLQLTTSLWDMGMNSVLAVSLAAALEGEFEVSFPASVAFDYGTLKDLAGFIHSRYFAATVTATGTQATATAAAATGTRADGLSSGSIVRRTSTPIRRRLSRKLSRTSSVSVAPPPEPEPLTARNVVLSVMAEFLPRQHFSEGADAPSLWSMGLSSVTAVQLVTVLSDRLDVALPPTLLFDYPTVFAVVGGLADGDW